ncbi:MAG: transcription antitermination factor NusB [Firmicutes bacterium]|nr:transcription antitermination factor NusB [Bacillota bacterium]
MSRRVAREIAFQTLFQHDIGKNEPEPTLTNLAEENGLNEKDAQFARDLVMGAIANLAALDQAVSECLHNWQLQRLAAVDRNILRLCAYELLFCHETPVAVAINEALELSKAFSSDESSKFLNGVLDRLAQQRVHRGGES